jgi:hypothetical protein
MSGCAPLPRQFPATLLFCFRFDDDQGLAPCGPYRTEKNPEYPILDSHPSARMISPQYGELLTKRKDFKAEVVPGSEKVA